MPGEFEKARQRSGAVPTHGRAGSAPGGRHEPRLTRGRGALGVVALLFVVAALLGPLATGGDAPRAVTSVHGVVVDLYGIGAYRYDTVFKGAGNRGAPIWSLSYSLRRCWRSPQVSTGVDRCAVRSCSPDRRTVGGFVVLAPLALSLVVVLRSAGQVAPEAEPRPTFTAGKDCGEAMSNTGREICRAVVSCCVTSPLP
jgi:hypothetical protein